MCREAYAAGIVDGEGCISLQAVAGGYTISVMVSMNNSAVPAWLFKNFGGNFGRYRNRKRLLTYHKWYIYGKKAQRFLWAILEYMVEKRELAELIVNFPVGPRGGGGLTPDQRFDRLFIHSKVVALGR